MRLRQSVIRTSDLSVRALDIYGRPIGEPVTVDGVKLVLATADPPFRIADDGFFEGWLSLPSLEFTMKLSRRAARRHGRDIYRVSFSPVPAKAAHQRKYNR